MRNATNERAWKPSMGEISGLGGGYEECCLAMLFAGLHWLDEHPDAKPEFTGFQGIFGLIREDNDDAKALTKAIVDAARDKGGATGAQHQTVVSHLMFIRAQGWDAYVTQLEARERKEPGYGS